MREFLEERHRAPGVYGAAGGDAKGGEVGVQRFEGGGGVFGEPDVACAAADGFDADRSGTGVEVGEGRVEEAGGEDVEQGFAEAIAGGAGGCSGRSRE